MCGGVEVSSCYGGLETCNLYALCFEMFFAVFALFVSLSRVLLLSSDMFLCYAAKYANFYILASVEDEPCMQEDIQCSVGSDGVSF